MTVPVPAAPTWWTVFRRVLRWLDASCGHCTVDEVLELYYQSPDMEVDEFEGLLDKAITFERKPKMALGGLPREEEEGMETAGKWW